MEPIRVDARAFKSWAEQQLIGQVPFALSVALNRTAKAVQQAERTALEQHFTIRRPWVTQGIMIPKFSDKHDRPMMVEVIIDPSRSFLWKFELGGIKNRTANTPIAVPSRAIRPGFSDLPPLDLYPKNLRLLARHGVTGILPPKVHYTSRGVAQLKGKRRTFVLEADWFGVRVPGVYQRFGPGRHDFRLIWSYKSRIPIPARLRFYELALQVVKATWPQAFEDAFQFAIRTAR